MPYAATDHLATDYFEGSVYITQEQYAQGVDALVSGRHVVIIDGEFTIVDDLPEVGE